jgi:hypothetical protein
MTESVMFFGIGFFVAALLGLLIDFNGESDVGVRAIRCRFSPRLPLQHYNIVILSHNN